MKKYVNDNRLHKKIGCKKNSLIIDFSLIYRRLPFQGILPTEMQRLSKYPLLLERLISSIESNKETDDRQQDELQKLRQALQQCKDTLNFVNDAAKVAHNKHRLEEIQKHLDTSSFDARSGDNMVEYKSLDVTKYK